MTTDNNKETGKYEQLGQRIGALVDKKNQAYGSAFDKAGEFLRLLWPNGCPAEQFDDLLALARIFDKMMRIATDRDALGESPYSDIAGYGLLGLHRVEEQLRNSRITETKETKVTPGENVKVFIEPTIKKEELDIEKEVSIPVPGSIYPPVDKASTISIPTVITPESAEAIKKWYDDFNKKEKQEEHERNKAQAKLLESEILFKKTISYDPLTKGVTVTPGESCRQYIPYDATKSVIIEPIKHCLGCFCPETDCVCPKQESSVNKSNKEIQEDRGVHYSPMGFESPDVTPVYGGVTLTHSNKRYT